MQNMAQPERKFLILVVDDEENMRFLLRQMLEGDGYDVIEANNGEATLEIFEQKKPDLLLIDAMMPLLDGMSTCRRIRNLNGGSGVPILMLTGLDDDKIVDLAFESGVSDFITKPFQFCILKQRVRRMLQLKKAEAMLEEKIVNERSITNMVYDGIIITDKQNCIISFNPSCEEIFEYRSNEAIGKSISTLIPELNDETMSTISSGNETLEKHIKLRLETTGIKKDSTAVEIEINVNGLDTSNKLITVHDLTERKQTQNKLKMAGMVFENIKEALGIIDSKSIIQFVNPAFLNITGYQEHEIHNKALKSIIPDAKSRAKLDCELINFSESGTMHHEMIIRGKNQKDCPVYMFISYIGSELLTNERQYVIIFHDITEQIKIRSRQEMLQKQAAGIQKMTLLSTVSAGIIHEINQPLNSIKILSDGMLYLSKKGKSLEISKVLENLQKISDQIVRIDEIIKQMRAFASYRQSPLTTKCNLNDAVEKAHEVLLRQLTLKGIKITKNLAEPLPDTIGNVNIIEEVALNLIINAMQALEKTRKKDKEIICTTYSEGNKIILEISDNATGINDEIKDKIFDPFFSTKTIDGGMGLGLALVQTILTSYDGKIEAANNSLGGATFTVGLPISSNKKYENNLLKEV